jgi:hypothetical protein
MFDKGRADSPCRRHCAQADVESPGSVHKVLHDDREQRAENSGSDAVEDLHADQPVRVVGRRAEEAARRQDGERGQKDRATRSASSQG